MAAARLGTAAPAGCRPRRAALDGQPQGIRRGAVGRELARGHGRGPAGEAVGRGVSSCEASPPPFPVTSRPPRGRWRLARQGAGARPQPRPQRVQVGPGSPEGRGGEDAASGCRNNPFSAASQPERPPAGTEMFTGHLLCENPWVQPTGVGRRFSPSGSKSVQNVWTDSGINLRTSTPRFID